MKDEKKPKPMKNFNFYFPSIELTKEDFLPFDIKVLQDYYRNSFLDLIDRVS